MLAFISGIVDAQNHNTSYTSYQDANELLHALMGNLGTDSETEALAILDRFTRVEGARKMLNYPML